MATKKNQEKGNHRMKPLTEFTRTTLIGGVLIVLPIYVSILLLAKSLAIVVTVLSPVTAQIPETMQFRQVIASVILMAVCFLAGMIVRTGPGKRAQLAVERNLLNRILGYALVRGLAARMAARQEDDMFAVALVEMGDGLVMAFVVERHDDGAFSVFVPSVPTPAAGAVFIVPKERVHVVDVAFAKAASVVSKWGVGARDLRAAMMQGLTTSAVSSA
jgi:uncharacterized membrane protein